MNIYFFKKNLFFSLLILLATSKSLIKSSSSDINEPESWPTEIVISGSNENITAGLIPTSELHSVFHKICLDMGIIKRIPIYWENSPFLEKRGTIAGISLLQQYLLLSNLFDRVKNPEIIFTLYHETQHVKDIQAGLFNGQSPKENEVRAETAACQHINCCYCLQTVADANRKNYNKDQSIYDQGYFSPEQIEQIIQEKKIAGTTVTCLAHHKILYLNQNEDELSLADFLPETAKNQTC